MTNMSLRTLIVVAYGFQPYQIAGDPPWISTSNYDIQATASGNTSVNEMEGPMLRALLEDRFHLTTHRETRQLAAYELTLVKSASKLQPTKDGACVSYATDAPPPTAATQGAGVPFCGYPHNSSNGLNRALDGAGVSMAALATNLSRELRRPVIDKTGLTGIYDLHLRWTADGPAGPAQDDQALPSIFTSLQEQLGLKLVSARGPAEVLIIDRIEKPSDN